MSESEYESLICMSESGKNGLKSGLQTKFRLEYYKSDTNCNIFAHDGSRIVNITVNICNYWK